MVSVGIDIVDNQRIGKLLSDSFVNKFLSDEELEEYGNILSKDRRIEYISGKIAAKEAVLKCLKDDNICSMKQIVIKKDEFGAPFVVYKGYNIQLSISHEKLYSVAVALSLP